MVIGLDDQTLRRFRWTMLVEAGETWQGLWQPWTESGYYFRDLDDGQRMELVVATLRSLYGDGLIRFFRYRARGNQEPSLVTSFLTPPEIEELLAPGMQLRVDPSFPDRDNAVAVWFEATEAGATQIGHLTESDVLPAPSASGWHEDSTSL